MDSLHGSDEEVIVIDGDDRGNLTNLIVKYPSCHFLSLINSAIIRCALKNAIHRMGISSARVNSRKVILIATSRNVGELASLGVILVESLVASESGLGKDRHLLLSHRSGPLCDLNNMGAILGLEDERLLDLGGENGVESIDHVVLGHPAEVPLLPIIS